ncbi:tetratricopeptide repeat protein, partial [Acetonema longum]
MRMHRLLFIIMTIVAGAVSFPACPTAALAEFKEIVAEGSYTMGEGETMKVAQERALTDAKRMAVEQAGTYVESYSKVNEYRLTEDEIKVVASGIMEVEVLSVDKVLIGDGIRFRVKIRAKVSVDKIQDIKQKLEERSMMEEYKKLQLDYARMQQELEALKRQLQEAQTSREKKAVQKKIAGNETEFTAADWVARGHNEQINGDYQSAIASYSQAIKLNPQEAKAYYNRASCYYEQAQFPPAIEDYRQAVRLNPQHALAYYFLAASLESSGKRVDALPVYQQFLELDQGQDTEKNNHAKSRMALLQQDPEKSAVTPADNAKSQEHETKASTGNSAGTQETEVKTPAGSAETPENEAKAPAGSGTEAPGNQAEPPAGSGTETPGNQAEPPAGSGTE